MRHRHGGKPSRRGTETHISEIREATKITRAWWRRISHLAPCGKQAHIIQYLNDQARSGMTLAVGLDGLESQSGTTQRHVLLQNGWVTATVKQLWTLYVREFPIPSPDFSTSPCSPTRKPGTSSRGG